MRRSLIQKRFYASDTLIRFNGVNYISQSKVQKVSPSDSNPWRVFVDWTGTKERVGTPKKAWPETRLCTVCRLYAEYDPGSGCAG